MQTLVRIYQKLNIKSKVTRLLSTHNEYGRNDTFYYKESPISNKIENDKIPLVLLLGWAGSIDKHVYKYAQMYEKFGYRTIRISPSAKLSLFQTNLHNKYAKNLLDMIKSKDYLANSPIIVHTFSNAGVFIYRHVTKMIHNENSEYAYLKSNFKTIIYDSGPGLFDSYLRLFRAVVELVQHEVKIKFISQTIAAIGMLVFFTKNFLTPKPNNFDKTFNAVKYDKFQVPILSFISKADDLIDYKQTIEILNERRMIVPNLKIDIVIFEDSAHCTHYSKYHDVYLEKLKKHLIDSKLPLHEN